MDPITVTLDDLRLEANADPALLSTLAARRLGISPDRIKGIRILKRSLDCRKKPFITRVYKAAVSAQVPGSALKKPGIRLYKSEPYNVKRSASSVRPVVVGSGPAGLFAALVLSLSGLRPLILERGEPVDLRKNKVERYWSGGELDPESNVQFGEGGAGAFSDGKLNTNVKNRRIDFILESFHRYGAPESVLFDAKPHVGTDVLEKVLLNMRRHLEELGAQFVFSARFVGFSEKNGAICGVEYEKGGEKFGVETSRCILAPGHSAHDTFRALFDSGVAIRSMPVAIGARIEHRQRDVDVAQYGLEALGRYVLPPAEYKLSANFADFSVHTFCMCPGGVVVAASSDPLGVVTNGMSRSARDGVNANSALLVSTAGLYDQTEVFSSLEYIISVERRAREYGGGLAPAQLAGDFLARRPSVGAGTVTPTYRPGVRFGSLDEVLGETVCDRLREGLVRMDRMIPGFASPDAVLTAPETRSSSPVRILRGEDCQSSVAGLYPCGEGAGFAGGIVSAAADGMLCAEKLIDSLD